MMVIDIVREYLIANGYDGLGQPGVNVMRLLIVIIALLLLSACTGQQQAEQAEMSSGIVIDFSYATFENSRRVRFYITVHGFDYAGQETIRQWQIESKRTDKS